MEFNEQQLQAINCNDSHIVCLAGAGAGKTACLIERVSRQVKEGVDPRSILAFTFTNAAALEMRERYKQKNPTQTLIPEFRTFHSFCYSLIGKDIELRKAIGYSHLPQIVDTFAIERIEKKVKLALGLEKMSDKKLKSAEPLLDKKEEWNRQSFQKMVKNEINKENVITFDMLCYDVAKLFTDNNPLTDKYKEQYKYIICDESQDTDPKQFKFIGSFQKSNFFIVGDILQSIYMWRGCSPEPIMALVDSGQWTVIKLFENYRSTTQICEFANRITKGAKDEHRIEMHGQREGENVHVISGSNASYRSPVDTDHLSILLDNILQNNEQNTAVLCRSNKEVTAVSEFLTERGIVNRTDKPDGELINIVKSLNDNDFFQDWLASSCFSAEEYANYIREKELIEDSGIVWFANAYRGNELISEKGRKVTNIRKILKCTPDVPEQKWREILAYLEISTDLADDIVINTDQDILEGLEELAHTSMQASVYVGTIHSSKGLEYNDVYLMGVYDKMFKINSDEMRNLYYVGATRARNRLYVFRR